MIKIGTTDQEIKNQMNQNAILWDKHTTPQNE